MEETNITPENSLTEPITEPVEEKTATEECKPCKLNIGAAMMVAICKDMSAKDVDFGMDCKVMENELVEKEEKIAPKIIDDIYQKVMEKGSPEDKETAQEIYDLSHGTEAAGV